MILRPRCSIAAARFFGLVRKMPSGFTCAGFFCLAYRLRACVFPRALRFGAITEVGPAGKFRAFAKKGLGGGCCIFARSLFSAFTGSLAALRLRIRFGPHVIIWFTPRRPTDLTVMHLINGCYALFVGGFSVRLSSLIRPGC